MGNLKIWDKDYGISEHNGKPVVSSRYISDVFGKNHQHILETIRKITEPKSGLSEEFGRSNFRQSSLGGSIYERNSNI